MTRTTLLESLYHTPGGKHAIIALVHRPDHPNPQARYLAYACVDAWPRSLPGATREEALAHCARWYQEISAEGYVQLDPFALASAKDAAPGAAALKKT